MLPFLRVESDFDDVADVFEFDDEGRSGEGEALRLRFAGGERLRAGGDLRRSRLGDGERRLRTGEGDLRCFSSSLCRPFLRLLRRSRERERSSLLL